MACLKTHVWGNKPIQDVKANSQLVTMSAIFRLLVFCEVVIRPVLTTRNSAVLVRLGNGFQRGRGGGIIVCYIPVSASVADNTLQDIRRPGGCGCETFKSKAKSFCGA